jgi:hypothetical protein
MAECFEGWRRDDSSRRSRVDRCLDRLQMNMISQRAYAIVVLMTGTTTLVALPLLRYLFREDGQIQSLEVVRSKEHASA